MQVPAELGVDHFAAFPSELARRCILGWTPSGWCTACGEPRRAVVDSHYRPAAARGGPPAINRNRPLLHSNGHQPRSDDQVLDKHTTITGYACACPTTDAPTTPAVVADFFCGTGTAPAVAHHLGRHGIGVDLSRDYLRLAEWRCTSDTRLKDKVRDRSGIPNPEPPAVDGQMNLFGEGAA